MKFNILAKYLIAYVVIAAAAFTAISTLIYKFEYDSVYKEQSNLLYRQAVAIAQEYAPDYFSSERLRIVELELDTISELNESRIMFIDTSGQVILDTDYNGSPDINGVLYSVPEFNYDSLGASHSMTGDFYGVFDSPQLSSFAPINSSFVMKGYVAIHLSEEVITERVYTTFNANYITLLILLLLNIIFILIHIINVHKPIKGISKAITEYGKGNLAYRVAPAHNDEIGRLAVSLDYMASELNEMDKFQQKFLSNISHDFRSPLTSIKGYLEAIADGTIPPELMHKYIDIVLFETERLTKLTSNILTLNELDPKTVRLDQSSFDINAVIKHIIETFEGTCKKKNIRFQLILSNETAFVYADKEKIQQVIYNLVDNAIKFSAENSIIYISLKQKNEKIFVSVKDTGAGIPKESLDKIWDRFYKSDSSRGRDKKGSGLGLSITKEIIQAHDETIDVISTVGVGTEFIFSLPIVKQK